MNIFLHFKQCINYVQICMLMFMKFLSTRKLKQYFSIYEQGVELIIYAYFPLLDD